MDPLRYDRPAQVMFGNQEITLEPLRGLRRLQAFETAVMEEIIKFKEKLEESGEWHSPEHLLVKGIDSVRLLKLGAPDMITDELLEESTASERLGALCDIMRLNRLAHLTVFVDPGTLLDVAMRMKRFSDEALKETFGPALFDGALSGLESAGATSSTS